MKLHLPKALFAAVVAVLGVQYASADITTEVKKGENAIVIGTGEDAKTYDVTLLTGNSNKGIKVGDTVTLAEGTILGFGMTSSTGTGAPGSGNGNYFTETTYTYAGDILVYDSDTTDSTDMGLIIDNGNSYQVITFSRAVSGNGTISILSSAPSTGITFKFTGNMSAYTGNMKGANSNKFEFNGATSGTGTLSTTNKVTVVGSTMNNSAITAGTLDVSGTSSFAGDVTATTLTLGSNAKVSIAENKTLSISDIIAGSTGQLTFGNGAKVSLKNLENMRALEHDSFGYLSNGVDIFAASISLSNPSATVAVQYNGTDYTADSTGAVVGLTLEDIVDSSYYIRGAAKSSAILAANDNIADSTAVKIDKAYSALEVDQDIVLPRLQATLGKISLTEDLTVTGASSITGTIVEGAGELVVADGATLKVDSIAKNLKSDIRIDNGGTMQFLGTGADAIDYDASGRTIYVDGTMDVGTTRQTVGKWDFELTGGTIQGAGQATHDNVGLDFHAAGTITGKALEGATAAAPTKSTISTNIRYKGQLSLNVDANARLDITGKLINNSGTLAITVNDGGELNIRRQDATETTLNAVTLNGGSLFRQGTTGPYTTNITTLTVGADGGVIGTSRDASYGNGHSYQSNIKIGTLTGTGDLIATSNSNTSIATTIFINGGTGYSGTVKVQNWSDTGSSRRTDLDIASNTALANAVIELGGGTNDSSSHTTNVVLGSSTVTLKGIKDATGRASAGNIIVRPPADANSSVVPSTLTINTAGNDYSTKSGVKEDISLVKSGEGKQSFSGDMGSFNGTITVNAGELEFLKASTTLNVTELTVAGGKLTVNGTVNTGSKLSYTSGTIDANLNVKTGTALTLNGTVDMEGILTLGDSLTLDGSKLTDILRLTEGGKVELFSGVTSLKLGDRTYTAGSLTEDNGLAFGEVFSYAAPMSNATTGELYLGFDANGVVFAGMSNIPEPTTATLSLLALAGLAARRRRK